MKNVFVRTDLIKPLTGEELSVVLALNKLCNDEKFGFDISLLEYTMYNEISNKQRLTDSLIQTVKMLIDKGILKVLNQWGKGKHTFYECTNENIYIDCEKEIYTYFSYDTFVNTNKININMIKTICAIASYFNNDNRVAWADIDTYYNMYDICTTTFKNHIKILEEKKILYIYHHETYNINGDIKTPSNNYGEYSNKENVQKVAKEYIYNNIDVYINPYHNKLKDGRSIKIRYNYFVDGADYSEDKVKLIYEDCIRYNEFYKNRYELYHHKEDKKRLLDLSVFDMPTMNIEF